MARTIKAVVITVSDRCARGEQEDFSGAELTKLLAETLDAQIVAAEILADDLQPLSDALRTWADRADVDLIVTTGGTGLAPRDNTPEATRAVIEREASGLAEAMRIKTLDSTPTAMLSRGVCGVRSKTLIVNLPGSPAGVRECFAVIAPVLAHAVRLVSGEPTDHKSSGH